METVSSGGNGNGDGGSSGSGSAARRWIEDATSKQYDVGTRGKCTQQIETPGIKIGDIAKYRNRIAICVMKGADGN